MDSSKVTRFNIHTNSYIHSLTHSVTHWSNILGNSGRLTEYDTLYSLRLYTENIEILSHFLHTLVNKSKKVCIIIIIC